MVKVYTPKALFCEMSIFFSNEEINMYKFSGVKRD